MSLIDQTNMDARFSKTMMTGNTRVGGEYEIFPQVGEW